MVSLSRFSRAALPALFLAVSVVFVGGNPAMADCTGGTDNFPDYDGTGGLDSITCDDVATIPGTNMRNNYDRIQGMGGADTIVINNNPMTAGGFTVNGGMGNGIFGGAGGDSITINGGQIDGITDGGDNADIITINGGSIFGGIQGGGGADTIDVNATLDSEVHGGDGADTINLVGAALAIDTAAIFGDAGNDAINVGVTGANSVSIVTNVDGGLGNDFILFGANTGSVGIVGGNFVTGGDDRDRIEITKGQFGSMIVQADILGGAGNDSGTTADMIDRGIFITAANGLVQIFGNVDGGNGNDRIDIGSMMGSAIIISMDVLGGDGNDDVSVIGDNMITISGDIDTDGMGTGVDTVTINNANATVAGMLLTGAGADVIDLFAGTLQNDIDAGDGADTVTILSGFNFGQDVFLGAGVDSLTAGATTIASIDAGGGADTVGLTNTTVTGGIDLGGGDNMLTVDGAMSSVTGIIQSGGGMDTIMLNAGTFNGNIQVGGDNDSVTIASMVTFGQSVLLGNGNDTLIAGETDINGVNGGGDMGDDSATFNGTSLTGMIVKGDGSDDVFVGSLGGISGVTNWDGGDDSQTMDGYVDTLTFSGIGGNAQGVVNWEQIDILNGSNITFDDAVYATQTDDMMTFSFRVTDSGVNFGALGGMTWTGNWEITGSTVSFFAVGMDTFSIMGDVAAAGSTFDLSDGVEGDTLTVSGNLSTSGANSFVLDALLSDDSSVVDTVTVGGTFAAMGSNTIVINELGGLGGQTTMGIALITAPGSMPGDFTLSGPVMAGAYIYDLVLDGSVWELQSSIVQSIGAYANLLVASQNHVSTMTGPLAERMGELRPLEEWEGGAGSGQSAAIGQADYLAQGEGMYHPSTSLSVWAKGVGASGEYEPDNSLGLNTFDQTTAGFALGGDVRFSDLLDGGDRLYVGAMVGFGQSDGSSPDIAFRIDGWTTGLYVTYLGANSTATPYDGLYIDGIVHVSWLDVNLDSTMPPSTADYDTTAWGGSIEAGYGFEIDDGLILEPQARLSYTTLDQDDFTGGGLLVGFEESESLEGRFGARLQKHWNLYSLGHAAPYIEAHVVHEFKGDNGVTVSGIPVSANVEGTRYELGMGLDARIGRDIALFGSVDLTLGEHIDQAVEAVAGARIAF